MALKIVWSNPRPLPEQKARVREVIKDEYGSVYIASYDDGNEEFELMKGRTHRNQQDAARPESA